MTPGAFWDFAVAVYGRPGVAQACLHLQDTCDLDVNLILFCLWLAEDGQDVGPVLGRALDLSRSWQAGIEPLRRSRRALKGLERAYPALTGLRQQMKDRELAAERGEIAALENLASGRHPRVARPVRELASSNLQQYLAATNNAADLLGRDEVLRILEGAFEPSA